MNAWTLSCPSHISLRPCPRSFYTLCRTKTKSLHLSFTISLHFSFDIFPCFKYIPNSLYTLGLHLDLGFDGRENVKAEVKRNGKGKMKTLSLSAAEGIERARERAEIKMRGA